jgi:hypothetical protein
VGGALFGFTPAHFALVCVVNGAMIGQLDQINGDPASLGAQATGQQASQHLAHGDFQERKVAQLGGQLAQHSHGRRRAFEVLTGLVNGQARSRSKHHNLKKVSWLHLIPLGL